jgi:uncharacterized lipoprotein YajG
MIKPLTLLAGVLLLAGCSATDPTAPAPTAPDPSFAHGSTGCPVAAAATAGTPGAAGVALGCLSGQ